MEGRGSFATGRDRLDDPHPFRAVREGAWGIELDVAGSGPAIPGSPATAIRDPR